MKVTDSEVKELVDELDREGAGQVNYKDFLKYSYLCQMFISHLELENILTALDHDKQGLISVAQLDDVLQNSEKFNFPPQALDTVFREMLGGEIGEVARNCVIKIEPFMESLKNQFEKVVV